MDKNTKRIVLITGASSGIGKTCAIHLHKRGYRVYGTSRYTHSDNAFEMIQMDVDSDISVKQCIDFILEKEGRVDVVVNNAGFGIAGAVEDTSIDEAKAQFETNFFGVLRVCQTVLPIMRKQEGGWIVNISSIAGLIALPFHGLYSASKFALEGLTEALRLEVKSFGIKVVLIEPGNFNTQFAKHRRKTLQSQQSPVYLQSFNNSLEVMETDEMRGASPDRIACLLERIIKIPLPRLRYTTGPISEKAAIIVKKIIPQQLFESIIRKYYQMS